MAEFLQVRDAGEEPQRHVRSSFTPAPTVPAPESARLLKLRRYAQSKQGSSTQRSTEIDIKCAAWKEAGPPPEDQRLAMSIIGQPAELFPARVPPITIPFCSERSNTESRKTKSLKKIERKPLLLSVDFGFIKPIPN